VQLQLDPETFQCVIHRPELADRKKATLSLHHTFRRKSASRESSGVFDVAKNFTVCSGDAPQIVVQLNARNADHRPNTGHRLGKAKSCHGELL